MKFEYTVVEAAEYPQGPWYADPFFAQMTERLNEMAHVGWRFVSWCDVADPWHRRALMERANVG